MKIVLNIFLIWLCVTLNDFFTNFFLKISSWTYFWITKWRLLAVDTIWLNMTSYGPRWPSKLIDLQKFFESLLIIYSDLNFSIKSKLLLLWFIFHEHKWSELQELWPSKNKLEWPPIWWLLKFLFILRHRNKDHFAQFCQRFNFILYT